MENQIRKTITTVGGLTICTLLGVALRFWIRDWANFVTPDGNTGNIVFGLIYVQVLGCLIMGFLVYSKPKFVEISESYYIGLTVGFCGSLTTFSSWQTDISLVIFGFGEINASLTGVQKAINACSILFVTISGSVFFFYVGNHIWMGINGHLLSNREDLQEVDDIDFEPSSSDYEVATTHRAKSLVLLAVPILFCLLYLGLFALMVVKATSIHHSENTETPSDISEPMKLLVAITFGPPGAFFRWQMSVRLNRIINSFPIGTFTSNIVACVVAAIVDKLMQNAIDGTAGKLTGITAVLLQEGVVTGFCGSLSTVSSFVSELVTVIDSKHIIKKYTYFFTSVIVSQILIAIIFLTV